MKKRKSDLSPVLVLLVLGKGIDCGGKFLNCDFFKCIRIQQICDGIYDCEDLTDEKDCLKAIYDCNISLFKILTLNMMLVEFKFNQINEISVNVLCYFSATTATPWSTTSDNSDSTHPNFQTTPSTNDVISKYISI